MEPSRWKSSRQIQQEKASLVSGMEPSRWKSSKQIQQEKNFLQMQARADAELGSTPAEPLANGQQSAHRAKTPAEAQRTQAVAWAAYSRANSYVTLPMVVIADLAHNLEPHLLSQVNTHFPAQRPYVFLADVVARARLASDGKYGGPCDQDALRVVEAVFGPLLEEGTTLPDVLTQWGWYVALWQRYRREECKKTPGCEGLSDLHTLDEVEAALRKEVDPDKDFANVRSAGLLLVNAARQTARLRAAAVAAAAAAAAAAAKEATESAGKA